MHVLQIPVGRVLRGGEEAAEGTALIRCAKDRLELNPLAKIPAHRVLQRLHGFLHVVGVACR